MLIRADIHPCVQSSPVSRPVSPLFSSPQVPLHGFLRFPSTDSNDGTGHRPRLLAGRTCKGSAGNLGSRCVAVRCGALRLRSNFDPEAQSSESRAREWPRLAMAGCSGWLQKDRKHGWWLAEVSHCHAFEDRMIFQPASSQPAPTLGTRYSLLATRYFAMRGHACLPETSGKPATLRESGDPRPALALVRMMSKPR